MMFSIAILSVAVVFATMVTGTIKTTRDATFENIAFRIADSKLAELRNGGYDALPASGPFSDSELASVPQGAASTTVTDLNTKMKEVMVGVSWQSAEGTTRYVSLVTLITQSGGL